MNHTIRSSELDDYLLIHIEGTWPRGSPEKIIDSIADLSEQHPGLPVLIDMRSMEDIESIGRDYFEATLIANTGLGQGGRIAVLDILERRNSNDFFETAAFNHGMTCRFFYSGEQEALAWLLSERTTRHD